MFPGIFHMRKGFYKPSDEWKVVRFQKGDDRNLSYKTNEVNAFVSELVGVLRNNYA